MKGLLVLAVIKLTLRLEVGPEYDSNANRAEVVQGAAVQDAPTGSALARSTARLGFAWRRGANAVRLSGLLGGKVFFSSAVQDQNMLVGQLAFEDRVRAARWLELGVMGDYYDVGQQTVMAGCSVRSCDRHRDFRSGNALARLAFLADPGSLTLSGGYRGFAWKPDPAFDFHAGRLDAQAAVRLYAGKGERPHEFDLSAAYHLERRSYASPRELNACPPGAPLVDTCIAYGADLRSDWFHEATAELTWVQLFLLTAAYSVQLTRSNSFGQSLVRHVVTLKASARLPWQLYLTLKGQLLVTRYADRVLLDRQVNSQTFVSIDEENRNAFLADLERPIGKTGLAIAARYSLYTNELGTTPVSFLRHVAYLGLSYQLDRSR